MEMSDIIFGSVFIEGGFRPAIVKEGRIWNQVVIIDGPTVVTRKTKEKLKVNPIAGYDLVKLAARMSRKKNSLGQKVHISKSAKAILEEAQS
jgi:hypothetical protein